MRLPTVFAGAAALCLASLAPGAAAASQSGGTTQSSR